MLTYWREITLISKVSNPFKISLRPNWITKLVSNGGQIALENDVYFLTVII